jgi:hypothetical protein
MTMTSTSNEDSTLGTSSRPDTLAHLRDRIEEQAHLLTEHARQLSQFDQDLARLNERIDAHRHRGYHRP